MSLYHLHCDIIGRSGGKSAVGSYLYQAREKGKNEEMGKTQNYTRNKDKPLLTGFIAPKNSAFQPKKHKEILNFWNEVQKKENRKNSQFARDFDIALQDELSLEQNTECLYKWIQENWASRGLCSSVAIHPPHTDHKGESNKNLHAHIMVALRKVDQDGWTEKDREGNDREFMRKCRKSWADIVNAKFKELGINQHIDERTLEEQGIDRQAQKHNGVVKTAIERKEKAKQWEQEQINKALEKINAPKPTQKTEWEQKIEKMTPGEWSNFMKNSNEKGYVFSAYGEFTQNIIRAEEESQVLWVEQNQEQLKGYFLDFAKAKTDKFKQKQAQIRKPWTDARAEKGLFSTVWTCSDGSKYKNDPVSARFHEQKLRTEYDKVMKPLYDQAKESTEQYKAIQNQDFKQTRLNLLRIEHKTVGEKMKTGAVKIFQESKIFEPIRQMISAVQKLKERKNNELKEYRMTQKLGQKKNQEQKPNLYQGR